MLLAVTALAAQAQGVMITGKVTTTDGECIGATVVEQDKGGRIVSSAVTDINGNFSLQLKNPDNSLKVTYVGCKPQTLPIKARRRFDIKLNDDSQTIAEVQVKGRKRTSEGGFSIPVREISGAQQTISMKTFEGMSVASVDEALQGRIAGLDIVGNSGDLGSGSSLRVRGTTSINSNSEPLILLNDIPFDSQVDASFDYNTASNDDFATLLSISPDDIEEITVLKDGAACAIWGARGANGIISIKTKKGVTGPTRVTYSYRLSGSWQPKGMEMLNGDDYTMLMKQAYFNRNQDESESNIPEFNYDQNFSEYEQYNNNTDWVKEVSQFGWTHDHTLAISGGGEKAKFRASIGYYSQTGTVIEQKLDRLSTRMNLEYQVSDRLKFTSDFSMTYTNNNRNYEQQDPYDSYKTMGLLDVAYRKLPNVGIYRQDANGNDTDVYYNILPTSNLASSQQDLLNPVAVAHLARNVQKNMRVIPTLRIQYDFIEPTDNQRLRYNGYVTFDIENYKIKRFLPKEIVPKTWLNEWINRSEEQENEGLTIMTDQNITWMPDLGADHSLMLYGSWQMTSGNSQNQQFTTYGSPSESITDATAGGNINNLNSELGQWRSMAVLGRLHYAYQGRYILDATIRWDGSTRFGPGNRWGSFPSVSGKWIVSDEKFMSSFQKWLSELSLRAGWGITGNMPDREYLYFARYNGSWSTGGNNYNGTPTIKPSSIELTNLKWERSTSVNLGLNLGLLDDRFYLDLNVYHRRTEDMLFKDQRIPSSTGFGSLSYINAGTMDNDGWELNVNTNNLINIGKFTIDLNANLSNNKNTIRALDENVLDSYNGEFDYNNGNYLTRVQTNNSFGSIYGLRSLGVYQYDKYSEKEVPGVSGPNAPVVRDKNGNVVFDSYGEPVPMYFAYGTTNSRRFRGGDAIYEDVNKDGTIDELDVVYLGNCNPKLNGGFGFTIRYNRRLSLTCFFNFRYGNKVINYARMNAENMYTNDNQCVSVNWRWRKDGDITNMPRALYQDGRNWMGSDRFVEDGSFLRWKQLTLNYQFDPKTIKKIGLNTASLYFTLNNILTWTKYSGVDPEVGYDDKGICADWSKTPRSKYFTFGITIGL